MIVISITNCPPKVRGDLSKWLLEISPGVFVGNINKRVRENLWNRVCENIKNGYACLVYSTNNEQRLSFETFGSTWKPIDYDGITLIKRPITSLEKADLERCLIPDGYSKAAKFQKSKRIQQNLRKKENNDYVIVDLETTGLDFKKDKIIEIGALLISNNEIEKCFSSLLSITEIPKEITELTGISEELIREEGKSLEIVLKELYDFIGDYPIVGYNIAFDLAFLKKAFNDIGLKFTPKKIIDVLKLVKKELINVKNYKLNSVAEYYSIDTSLHRALNDCEVTFRVYTKLKKA